MKTTVFFIKTTNLSGDVVEVNGRVDTSIEEGK